MSTLKATWTLYVNTTRAALSAFGRSAWVFGFLIACQVVIEVLTIGMGQAGPASFGIGFIVGALSCLLAGWYLALLRIVVQSPSRRVAFSDLKDNIGVYFWETLQVCFLFMFVRLGISFAAPPLLLLYFPVAALLFNPVIERVYLEDATDPVSQVRGAVEFMMQNWPEWMAPHVLFVVINTAALTGIGFSYEYALIHYSTQFGPSFDYLQMTDVWRLAGIGIPLTAALAAFTHFQLLFRGLLYKKLARSSRRSRAWQAKF